MSVFGESLKYFKRYTPGFVVAIFMGLVVNSCIALVPLIPTLLIDRIITPALGGPIVESQNLFSGLLNGFAKDEYWKMFGVLAILFLVLLVIKHGVSYFRWNLLQYCGTKVENHLRSSAFKKVILQDSNTLSKYSSGDLVTICSSDIMVLKEFYSNQIIYFFGVLSFWGLSIYFLSTIHWALILCPFVGGVVSLFCMRSYTKAVKKKYSVIRDISGKLNTVVQENIQGVRVVSIRYRTTRNNKI